MGVSLIAPKTRECNTVRIEYDIARAEPKPTGDDETDPLAAGPRLRPDRPAS
jgi:hypothetical protein